MSKELRPCPFCGEKVTLDYRVMPNRKHWFITCDYCGMMYQYTLSQRKYVKDGWNTRPIEDALNKRIAELEAERRWIPVGERLPEEKQSVLALDRTGTAYHWEYSRSLSNIFVGYYTHWMPLPKLPEVKE